MMIATYEEQSSNNETISSLDQLAAEAVKQAPLEETQPGDRKRKPTHLCSERVQKKRHQELLSLVEPLAKRVHNSETSEQAVSLLRDQLNYEQAKKEKGKEVLEENQITSSNAVSLEECAIFCHRFNVNSKNYREFKELLKIPYSYTEIEAFHREKTKTETGLPNPKPMDGVYGHTYGLIDYLRYFFSKKGYKVNKKNRIKIAADGGSLSSKKSKYEIGTFESVDEPDVGKLRSHKNSHVIFMFWGDESRENLQLAMQRLSSDIELLKQQKNKLKITTMVDNQPTEVEIEVEIWLTCDMACLCKVLGLCDVFHTKSKFKCPWCEVIKDKIGDFTIPHWALRSFSDMTVTGATQEKRKTKRPGENKEKIVEFVNDCCLTINFE